MTVSISTPSPDVYKTSHIHISRCVVVQIRIENLVRFKFVLRYLYHHICRKLRTGFFREYSNSNRESGPIQICTETSEFFECAESVGECCFRGSLTNTLAHSSCVARSVSVPFSVSLFFSVYFSVVTCTGH